MNHARLFLASCLALIVTAMSFAIRGDIMGALATQFELTKEQLGWIAGTAFWGFTVAMMIGGPLCDWIGMKRLLIAAFIGHAAGILLTIFAGGYAMLYLGTLCIGLANGFVEAACNPLIATIYPEEKTKKLNHFHVWFPGGIVIGGLLAAGLTQLAAGAGWSGALTWQLKMATMLVPLVIYGFLFLGQEFPPTERKAAGVSATAMLMDCLRPLFFVMIFCMLLTAAMELGPNQWIPNILDVTVLVWISALMAVGRQFAGPIVRRLSPTGVLLASAIVTAIGLFWLSYATGWWAYAAATVFAIGICYVWPTMLGFTSERMPKTGALGLALMGGAGMLSVGMLLPFMGHVYDRGIAGAVPSDVAIEDLQTAAKGTDEAAQWLAAEAAGGALSLRVVAIAPLVVAVVFGALFIRDRVMGGYRAETIGDA